MLCICQSFNIEATTYLFTYSALFRIFLHPPIRIPQVSSRAVATPWFCRLLPPLETAYL